MTHTASLVTKHIFYSNVHFSICYFKLLCFCFCSGKIDEQEWRFLLTGGVALENRFPNPASGWLTDKSWAEMVRCSALPAFKGILQHFTEHVSFGNFLLFYTSYLALMYPI